MRENILVVGSYNTDMVVRVERLPAPGETVLGGEFVTNPGGKGSNQAVAAARLGGRVSLLCKLGQDSFGDTALTGLGDAGINFAHVIRTNSAPTGVAIIMVDRNAENVIAVAPGANYQLTPADLHAHQEAFQQADVVLVQNEVPAETVAAAIMMASDAGATVMLNPAPFVNLPEIALQKVNILTPNRQEAAALAGLDSQTTSIEELGSAIRRRFGTPDLVITLGKEGVYYRRESGQVLPAFHVDPVDTTGAGDAFNGGLAFMYARSHNLAISIRFAAAVAAISTTSLGAQASLPDYAQVETFLAARL